jgi:uncharacterized iron-regulated membrane protein
VSALRPILFWMHLAVGVTAGAIILLMSFTGVLLMYERQILAWADSGYRSTAPAPGAARLPLEDLVERVRQAQPGLQPTAITVRADDTAAVAVAGGGRTMYVDAYRGEIVGEASRTGARAAMASLREWHRWLAMSEEDRATGRAITGWSTLLFLGLVVSGMFLWIPRRWTWTQVRAILLFRAGLRGKARDFNWHHAIGIWSAIPLFFVVISALPISFPWANALIYRTVGETPPPAPARPAGAAAGGGAATPVRVDGLDRAFATAREQLEGWRTIQVRVPAAKGAYAFTIDRGDGGQPHLRDTLTVSTAGAVVSFEPFSSQTLGRRLRSLSRFTHTGEVLGLAGQTVAGLVSAGATVLVWTGLALAFRRLLEKVAVLQGAGVQRAGVQRAGDLKAGGYLNEPHSSISDP